MTSRVLLIELLLGAALPLVGLAKRWLDVRRDFFMMAIYLQALVYVFAGPYRRLRTMQDTPAEAYATLATAAFPLVLVLFLGTYLWLVRRTPAANAGSPVRLAGNGRRLELVLYGLLAFAIAFWSIAWRGDLIFRRIGNPIVAYQLRLPFLDFVLYRTYMESLFFITAVVVLALVIEGRRLSALGWAAAVLNLLSAYVYLVINSRILLAILLVIVAGVWAFFWRGSRGFWQRILVGAAAGVLLLFYSTATTQRFRLGFSQTGGVTWRAFVPGVPLEPIRVRPPLRARARGTPRPGEAARPPVPVGEPKAEEVAQDLPDLVNKALFYKKSEEMPLSARLDGLDLMARMKPSIETLGYAWGKAWKVPIALMYLPLVDPPKAREYKLSLNMAAKNYLMHRYTSITAADYVSCMLTDAYGNFGYPGLALVGIFLGTVTGWATRLMARPPAAGWVLVALFALTHVMLFDQEFVSALVLWPKKLPFLVALLVASPFRVVRAGSAGR